jgi:xylulokinase
LATGGASANKAILQVLSDVFNAPVYLQVLYFHTNKFPFFHNVKQDETKSAMLGAAYQAKHGFLGEESNYREVTSSLPPPRLICEPYADAAEIYGSMIARYRTIEAFLLQNKS